MTINKQWFDICEHNDIQLNMGRCALLNQQQIAIFKIEDKSGKEQFYAIDNFCPFSESNTLSRGVTGDLNDKTVVASPLYKQHFDLATGICLENKSVSVKTYSVRLNGNTVQLAT